MASEGAGADRFLCAVGCVSAMIDAVGEQRVSLVDALGRTVRTRTYHRPTDPDEHELYSSSESEYDELGRLLAVYQNREQARPSPSYLGIKRGGFRGSDALLRGLGDKGWVICHERGIAIVEKYDH